MNLEFVLNLYKDIYRKVNGKLPKISDTQIKSIEKFYIQVGKELNVSENWWFEYLCYQFEYFCEKDTRFGKGKILPNWIFGKEAYKRWENRDDRFWMYWVDMFVTKYEINRPKNFTRVSYSDIVSFKERERRRFFNTEKGLAHCLENYLYDAKGETCRICKFKKNCDEFR